MNWFKVRYIDNTDNCIQTVEVGSLSKDLSIQEATESIIEALEADGIAVSNVAVLDVKKKGWFG